MATGAEGTKQKDGMDDKLQNGASHGRIERESEEEEEEDEEDEEDEEPRLKYASLTRNLGSVYRNGDATSAFLVAGDKMVKLSLRKLLSTLTSAMLKVY